MSAGELSFLALVIACFTVFAVAVIWLRVDYVKHRAHQPSPTVRLQAQMAE